MTSEERIAALEARLAYAEMRIAQLETASRPYGPLAPQLVPNYPYQPAPWQSPIWCGTTGVTAKADTNCLTFNG